MFQRAFVFTVLAVCLTAASAAAQPQLTLSSTVIAPGETVSVAIGGAPGALYALLGSSVDTGEGFARENLKVGRDVVILATGVLDSAGQATLGVKPPFLGSVLDRYYFQAVTSFSPRFDPLEYSATAIVRNADLVKGLEGPQGPAGPAGPTGAAGPQGLTGSRGPSDAWMGGNSIVLPSGNFFLITQVQIANDSAAEVGMTCNLYFSGSNGGIIFAPASGSVRAARETTLTFVGTADILSGTGTISGNCGSLPANVTATFHIGAIQVATLHR